MGLWPETGLSYTLAWQYLKSTRQSGSITFMTRLCFIGVLIGTFALMLTLIIMSGFEQVISLKMQSINPDLVISAKQGRLDYRDLKESLLEKHGDIVRAISGSSTRQIILCNKELQSIVFLRGVDPTSEGLTSEIKNKIITSDGTNKALLSTLLKNDRIILGHKIAKTLGIKPDQTVEMLVPEGGHKHKVLLDDHKVKVAGLFKVGLEEYDATIAYCSLSMLQKLFEETGIDQLSIKLHPQKLSWLKRVYAGIPFLGANPHTQAVATLKKALPKLEIKSWQELYPALVASLKLEKYVMFFLLLLITLVASMNMVSLLFMQVQARRGDIAILKTMGMPAREIKKIFVTLGMGITVSAAFCGLVLAFLAGLFLQRFPLIKLPDVYYVSHLPAHLALSQFVFVFLLTLLISFIATWTPASMAQQVNITSVLRQE